jgi:hypothetical protein
VVPLDDHNSDEDDSSLKRSEDSEDSDSADDSQGKSAQGGLEAGRTGV